MSFTFFIRIVIDLTSITAGWQLSCCSHIISSLKILNLSIKRTPIPD
nr:MAG TPA: hypothetical protein [Caudoviricetes sp.]